MVWGFRDGRGTKYTKQISFIPFDICLSRFLCTVEIREEEANLETQLIAAAYNRSIWKYLVHVREKSERESKQDRVGKAKECASAELDPGGNSTRI